MPITDEPLSVPGPAVSRLVRAPAPAWNDNNVNLPPFFAPHAIFGQAAARELLAGDEPRGAVHAAEADRAVAALADELERIAHALRGATPTELATMGRNTTDPLELLILGFALGYTGRSSARESGG